MTESGKGLITKDGTKLLGYKFSATMEEVGLFVFGVAFLIFELCVLTTLMEMLGGEKEKGEG